MTRSRVDHRVCSGRLSAPALGDFDKALDGIVEANGCQAHRCSTGGAS
jgi:hypothetical protein